MSEQLQLRRGTASQVAAFTGAAGEVVFDTTNNRLVANDGVTVGGSAAAKLAEVITNTRTAVSDAAYTVLATDRMVAYTALTAARVVTLPASSAYPTGTRLLIVDETGNCSVTKTLTITPNGTDAIDGAASAVVNQAYGFIGLESNQTGEWTIVDKGSCRRSNQSRPRRMEPTSRSACSRHWSRSPGLRPTPRSRSQPIASCLRSARA